MFQAMDGWITRFEIDGMVVGGEADLGNSSWLSWQMDRIGGVEGKRVLELGPLEGAHTKILIDNGAREVIAIEGLRHLWLRCLVVKEIFRLNRARFLYGDFCQFVADYDGEPFDAVLASGVLYHQQNPAALIHSLARITDRAMVWSQVASDQDFLGEEVEVDAAGKLYRGRVNDYQGARETVSGFCGGVHPTAVWLYPEELRTAFTDAGFGQLDEQPPAETHFGPVLMFVAAK